ncbi:unnamed protein product [Cylindrotheca closterium]|uniref:Post-SET domain-containing protein n=1 Tax=Cylindrotheca closterium TaxID=2856 RepID=A0AAD2JNB7_9STRA|nr:unnamed protein product [Cylindrotheca closterium]
MMRGRWRKLGATVRPILTDIPGSSLMSLNRSTTSHFSSATQEINEANERCLGSVQINRTADGRGYGIFAMRHFAPGERVIESIALKSFDKPHSHSIQVDWKSHVYIDLPARFLNHMCDPNLRAQLNDSNAYDFVALRTIEEGTEVGHDYETTEYELSEPIQCGCGSPKCRKVLKGFRYNESEILKTHDQQVLSPYLLSNKAIRLT